MSGDTDAALDEARVLHIACNGCQNRTAEFQWRCRSCRRSVYVHSLASHTRSGSRESGSLGKLFVLLTPTFSILELCSNPGVQSEHARAVMTSQTYFT